MRRTRLALPLTAALALTGLDAGQAAGQPAAAVLQTFPLASAGPRSGDLRLIAEHSDGIRTAELPRRDTGPFSLVGVTWADPRAEAEGSIEVRTRSIGTGRWTSWKLLETDNPDASGGVGGPHVRGASDPLWVGPSDGIQARMVTVGRPLPAGLRVDLVNPDAVDAEGRLETVAARRDVTAVPDRAPGLPPRPVPRMVTRAGWGADEAIVKERPAYTGGIQVVFVHHTATGNDYSCVQAAGVLRGIQTYQVRSKGWNDVGYNFLVDKCGTVFEGRRGGAGRTVLGAHTVGFNNDASSIAVIGDYRGRGVTPRVRTVIAAVAAYKLGAYGNAPNGRVTLTSGGGPRFPKGQRATLWRIAGHRDAGLTACPGDALYAQLPSIRAIAGAAPADVHVLRIGGTALSARRYFTTGLVQPVWTTSTPSGLINRFEVWVDGVLRVATPAGHRTTRLRLTPGSHALTVRAVHLSGRSTTVGSRMIVDADAPEFAAKPALALRPGTIRAAAVPLRLRWNVGDGIALGSVRLTRPLPVNLGTSSRSRDVAAPANRATPFTVRATDRAGNATSATITRTPWVVSEVSAQRRGSWRTLRNKGYLGGTAAGGSMRGASASWTFTGASAALVFSRGPRAGRVGVFVDGRPQGMVDLRSARPAARQVVWSRSWAGSGKHTVRVVVEGTAGRPGVALDGLVYLG